MSTTTHVVLAWMVAFSFSMDIGKAAIGIVTRGHVLAGVMIFAAAAAVGCFSAMQVLKRVDRASAKS